MGEVKKSMSARAARVLGALALGSLAAVSVSGIGGERVGAAADATLERLMWQGMGAQRTPPKPIEQRRAKSAARRRRMRGG